MKAKLERKIDEKRHTYEYYIGSLNSILNILD